MIDIPNKLEEYGISPVIGVILMVAITVTLAAILGVFALEIGDSQPQTAQAGVLTEETEDGIKIRLQEANPSLEEIEILVGGSHIDGATIDQIGESVTVTVPEGGTVTVRGVTEGGDKSIIKETTASQDTTGGDSPKVVSGGESTPTPTTLANTKAPNCSNITYEENGTTSDPYEISNDHELQCMNKDLSGHYILVNDIDASKTNQWNGGSGFDPIGAKGTPFTGVLDGQGYEISGITINREYSNAQALISHNTGNVQNIGMENTQVTGGSGYISSLVGYNEGTITGVYTKSGTIERSSGWIGSVGGLVGYNSGTISNSYATINVDDNGSGGFDIGGLVGLNETSGTIEDSYATGDVTSSDSSLIGGFVGRTVGTIEDSYATGDVYGPRKVGGFVGEIEDNEISDSYSTGSVEVESGGYAGGFAGSTREDTTISKSYATGNVNGNGGFVGTNSGTVIKSYATGNVNGNNLTTGGFAGINSGQVKNSYTIGNVSSDADVVGGLVGTNEGGSITKSYAVGSVNGDSTVGGLVGSNGDDYANGTTTDSYWDTEATGHTNIFGSNSGGSASNNSGLTTSEMQGTSASSNMSALDFTTSDGNPSIWKTSSSEYPQLQWEGE